MSYPELKPCLRCGAEAVWEKKSGDLGYSPPSVRICCSAAAPEFGAKQLDGCFIRTPWISLPSFGDARGHRKANDSLARAWNQEGELGFPPADAFKGLKDAVTYGKVMVTHQTDEHGSTICWFQAIEDCKADLDRVTGIRDFRKLMTQEPEPPECIWNGDPAEITSFMADRTYGAALRIAERQYGMLDHIRIGELLRRYDEQRHIAERSIMNMHIVNLWMEWKAKRET